VSHISLPYCVVQRVTQQENFATKLAFTRRSWATLGRENEASFQVMFIYKYKELIIARRVWQGNERLTVVWQPRNIRASQTATTAQQVRSTL